jgi:NADPH2:quinone reductase
VRETADEIRHVVDLVAKRKLRLVIHDVVPLDRAADAHRVVEERRQYGKLILTP